jgi:hypothetical protein
MSIGSGTSFQTPPITATTDYYVAANDGVNTVNVGLPAALSTATSGAGTTNFGIVFDAISAFTLNTVTVYPVSAAANTPGTVTIDVVDGTGAILHSQIVDVFGNPAASPVAQTVTLNFDIVPGTNLKLRPGARSASITGLLFEPSAAAPGGNYGYPFTIPGVVTLLHSTLTAPPTTATCTATNGSIDLTVSAASAPFSYNWSTPNGSGLVNGQEDQSGLGVGTYFVTVTATNTGCSATRIISLAGPGGCDACPVIPIVSASPAGVCVNVSSTLTASGLVDMGITYGITFKYFDAPTLTPYTGGTVIATIPNGGLTNNFTQAQTTTSFATGGTYYIYAILDQNPTDPACRPFGETILTVVNTPSANAVANQTVCTGSSTTAITFSGPVPGTIYNWTNDNTAIGLAASGSGDIASFSATNATNAPITATITVTPVTSPTTGAECTGASITFTITVNPVPSVNAVSNLTYCAGVSVPSVVFTGNTPGAVYAWSRTNEAIGSIAANGTGNVPAFTATNATTAPLTSTFTVVATYTNNGVSCTGTPIQFTITVNPTPTVAAVANQTLCNGSATTAVTFSGTVTNTVFNWTNNNSSIGLAASGSGDIASFTAVNNGGAPVTATITVTPTFTNGGITCSGTPTSFTITVNPTAQVNQPANLTTCGGALTTVTFTTTTPGTTYTWTNNNTATGLAASGTGNISFTAAIVAVSTISTITVTPNYTNNGVSCPGTPRTFTITVDPLPTVTVTGGARARYCAAANRRRPSPLAVR